MAYNIEKNGKAGYDNVGPWKQVNLFMIMVTLI